MAVVSNELLNSITCVFNAAISKGSVIEDENARLSPNQTPSDQPFGEAWCHVEGKSQAAGDPCAGWEFKGSVKGI